MFRGLRARRQNLEITVFICGKGEAGLEIPVGKKNAFIDGEGDGGLEIWVGSAAPSQRNALIIICSSTCSLGWLASKYSVGRCVTLAGIVVELQFAHKGLLSSYFSVKK